VAVYDFYTGIQTIIFLKGLHAVSQLPGTHAGFS